MAHMFRLLLIQKRVFCNHYSMALITPDAYTTKNQRVIVT